MRDSLDETAAGRKLAKTEHPISFTHLRMEAQFHFDKIQMLYHKEID